MEYVRIQRKRTRGWKMPPDTVYVGRPTKWGNKFEVGLIACGCRSAGECSHNTFRRETADEAVAAFRELPRSAPRLAYIRQELRGKNLACWCDLDQPCHADVPAVDPPHGGEREGAGRKEAGMAFSADGAKR